MKRLLICFFAFLLLVTTCYAYSVPPDTIVYVTNSGEKYHRENCSYLKSSRSMTIAQAEASGYTPCSRCSPDVLLGEYESDWDGEPGGSSVHSTPRPTVNPIPSPQPEIGEGTHTLIWIIVPISVFVFAATLSCCISYRRKKKKYLAEYNGKSVSKEAGVPNWIFVDQDGVPRNKAYPNDKADCLVVYVTRNGTKYHSKTCKYAWNANETLLSEAQNAGLQKCKLCNPYGSPPEWLIKYRKIEHIRKKYKIQMTS